MNIVDAKHISIDKLQSLNQIVSSNKSLIF